MFGVATLGSQIFGGTILTSVDVEGVSYAAWPLSAKPSNVEFIWELNEDPTFRTELNYGSFDTAADFSNSEDKLENFNFRQHFLSETDKRTLDMFQRLTVEVGILPFTWTHPNTEVEYLVQLREPIKFTTEPVKSWTYMALVRLIGRKS